MGCINIIHERIYLYKLIIQKFRIKRRATSDEEKKNKISTRFEGGPPSIAGWAVVKLIMCVCVCVCVKKLHIHTLVSILISARPESDTGHITK